MGAPVSNHIPKCQYLFQKNERKSKTAPIDKLDPLDKAQKGSERKRKKLQKGTQIRCWRNRAQSGNRNESHGKQNQPKENRRFTLFLSASPLFLLGGSYGGGCGSGWRRRWWHNSRTPNKARKFNGQIECLILYVSFSNMVISKPVFFFSNLTTSDWWMRMLECRRWRTVARMSLYSPFSAGKWWRVRQKGRRLNFLSPNPYLP